MMKWNTFGGSTRKGTLGRMSSVGVLLRTVWVTGVLLVGTGCATTSGALERLQSGEAEMADLTWPLSPQLPVHSDSAAFQLQAFRMIERDGLAVNRFAMADTTGTHLEAPARLVSSQTPVDRLPAAQLIGPGVVVDVKAKVAQDPAYRVQKTDIEQWEADNGPIPPDAIVVIRTGWSERYMDPARYQNVGADGKPVYPGISEDAVAFLVRERRVQGLGIDTASLYAGSGSSAGQKLFLTSGKYHLNNLTELDRLPSKGATLLALPLRIQNGPGAPARVLAIIPKAKSAVEPGKKKVQGEGDVGGSQSPGMMGQ